MATRGESVGYKTNNGHVVALVHSVDGKADSDAISDGDTGTVVLLGMANGVRSDVTFRVSEAAAAVNEAFTWNP